MANDTIDRSALRAHEAQQEALRAQEQKEFLQERLAAYVQKTVDHNSPVMFHDEPKNKYSLPTGTRLDKAAKDIAEAAAAEQQTTTYNRQFDCRIEDGAVALHRVMVRVFGSVGRGITKFSFFGGEIPPTKLSVTVGLNEDGTKDVLNVATSEFSFSPLDATITIYPWSSTEHQQLFAMSIDSLVRNQAAIEGLFAMVEDEVKRSSIYKGQLLSYRGQRDGTYELQHVRRLPDPTIVYNQEVRDALDDDIIGLIKNDEMLSMAGIPVTFKALLWGPLGTGKSAACNEISLAAVANGRTVLEYQPTGVDSNDELIRVVNVAKMYAPAVVYIEDFDKFFTSDMSMSKLSTLTNLLDGADKNSGVSFVMTTNNVEKIHPSMTRAGRLTSLIEIGPLDKVAIRHMLEGVLGDQLEENIDYEAVWQEVQDFGPAFIRSTFDKAKQVSATRNGRLGLPLGTADLVRAARAKKAQADLNNKMSQTKTPEPNIQDLVAKVVKDQVQGEVASLLNATSMAGRKFEVNPALVNGSN